MNQNRMTFNRRRSSSADSSWQRRHRSWLCLALLAVLILAPSGRLAAQTNAESQIPLCVMTFNLRYAGSTPPNSWQERRPVMRDCIRHVAPDLIGTQEGLYPQLKDVSADLPEYAWIGQGREGGSHGEFMAVFYRRERFEPLEYDHFWLSDTPEVVGSSTWGNVNRRMVTWVRFRDRRSGREFHFWNTHLDVDVERARQKSAELICERMKATDASLPLIFTGDFNCAGGGSPAWDILVRQGGLTDTWPLARAHVNERLNSFNGFKPPKEEGRRIDWILVRGKVVVGEAEVSNYAEHGQTPSDHFPVIARLTLR